MSKQRKSIEDTRRSLIAAMSTQGEERTIPVRNDDVPKFLKELDACEEEFKHIKFVVK